MWNEVSIEDGRLGDRRKEAPAVGSFSLAGTFVPEGPLDEMPMVAAFPSAEEEEVVMSAGNEAQFDFPAKGCSGFAEAGDGEGGVCGIEDAIQ